ncbi:MAG TPA: HAD-IC family P-type ATPase, partial [Oligoflexia bacterium]|nr:HAD-IC family P-type ATPase [Oligoflexia bacterium]
LSGWFVALIILLAFSGGVFWWIHSGLYAALNSVLALLIVSCPCALALAAPVALSVGVRKAARLGVYIRGSETIEKLASAETIFLDKTGTITEGKMTVQEAICLLPGGDVVDFPEADAGLQRKIAEAVCLLERHSPHPAAAALIEYLRPSAAVLPEGWQTEEITGKGVRAHDAHGLEWRIGSWPWVKEQISLPAAQFDAAASAYAGQGLTPAALGHDGAVYALFALGDPVREGMRQAVQELRQDGRRCVILSGDDVQVVRSVALRLNIDEADIYAGLSPEEKTEIVIRANKQEMCAMTGDGLNDAGALQAASVAIGVSGGAEACLKIAQVFLSRPDAGNLALAFLGSRAVIRVIKLNFAISIIYNMCGAGLALCGLMNPLLAAVLMPLSSISVVISSVFGRTYFR